MTGVTGTAKLMLTGAMFVLAIGLLAVAAATGSAVPLFFMWVPLLALPWLLVRPGPGDPSPPRRS
jgi:hypothetical protein